MQLGGDKLVMAIPRHPLLADQSALLDGSFSSKVV